MKSVFIIVIAFVLFIPTTVFGVIPDISDDYFNTPEKLDWSIVFVTSRDNCSSNNQDALKFYTSLTRDYLYKFNFSHESFFVDCISKDMMFSVVDKLADYGDLTIVIPDYLMSSVDKHTTGSLGHYGSWIVDTIVSQAETFSIEDRDTAWTLSHELAHFGLNWKGYTHTTMANAVHEVQRMYNDCKGYDTTLTNCTYLWDSFNAPSNNGFPVMSPDYVIQVANSMNSNTYSSTIYPTFITLDSINSKVNYGEYEYISGKILNPDTTQGIANKKLIIKAITPSGSTLVLTNAISDKNGRFSTPLQFGESGTWRITVNFVGDTQHASTFSDMTSKIIVSNIPVSNIPQSKNNYESTESTSKMQDSDHDGIVDRIDKCPHQYGFTENNGCPLEKIQTQIYLENISHVKIGDEIVIKGRLFYQNSGFSIGVPQVPISILDDLMPYYPPHQDPFIGKTTTDQNGNFEVTWIARENPTTITSQGSTWTPKAAFMGFGEKLESYDGMESESFMVLKDTIIDESTINSDNDDGIIDDIKDKTFVTTDVNGIDVEFQLTGMSNFWIKPDTTSKKIEMGFLGDWRGAGAFTIALPRKLIDAKLGGEDADFILSYWQDWDGIPKYTEKVNEKFRILTITIPNSSPILTIQGTTMNDFSLVQPTKNTEVQIVEESQTVPIIDSDRDGIEDKIDFCPIQPETYNKYLDSDGCPDETDKLTFEDMDADGIYDFNDACPSVIGVSSNDGCPEDEWYQQYANYPNVDGDGVPDHLDECPNDPDDDWDQDGLCGDVDDCPKAEGLKSNNGCPIGTIPIIDSDKDGISDIYDNCILIANNDQEDIDLDGIGNSCDDHSQVSDNQELKSTSSKQESTEQRLEEKQEQVNKQEKSPEEQFCFLFWCW
jgi:hypothetical protein